MYFFITPKKFLKDIKKVCVIFQFKNEYYQLIINFLDDVNLVYQRAIFIDG
jgi:hypothetical protein